MHLPVLQREVLKYLDPKPNENFVDATLGFAGHTTEILKRNGPNGKVLGIEVDSEILKITRFQVSGSKFEDRLILKNDSYVNLKRIVGEYNFKPVSGILFDLGMSSWHLEESGRGFSFQRDEPLDMRYHVIDFRRSSEICYQLTAEKIINSWPEKEIERILGEHGEERFARRIAREIIEMRKKNPIKRTGQLVEIIKRATPSWYQRKRIHFATRTFQSLRIAVNDELENLKKALPQALEILDSNPPTTLPQMRAPGGRMVIISFHSLEDRIVKNFFKESAKKGLWQILTKKPIIPASEELQKNPHSRSAKLRAIIKI